MFQSLGSILFVIFNALCVMLSVSSQKLDGIDYPNVRRYGLVENYPYVVGIDILNYNIQPKKIERLCTGTFLFEPNYILTAAHCVVTEDRKSVVENGAITIVYNDLDKPKKTNPKKIIVHPEYLKTRDSVGELVKPFDICILESERILRGEVMLPLGLLPSTAIIRQHFIQAQANREPCMWVYYTFVKQGRNRYKLIAQPVTLVIFRHCQDLLKKSGIRISEETHLCTTNPYAHTTRKITCDMFGGSPLVCFRWPGVMGLFITIGPCNAPTGNPLQITMEDSYLLFTRVDHSMVFLEKNLGNITSGTSVGSDSVTGSGASYIYFHTGIIFVILCSSWKSGIETVGIENVGV